MSVRVVNIKNETCHVYCGRAGHGGDGYWGNPFKDGSRETSLGYFRIWFESRVKWDSGFQFRLHELKAMESRFGELKLGCFCAPRPCHADIIKEHLDKMPNIFPKDVT